MKPIEGYNKLRGGYYTPETISKFIVDWAIRTSSDTILEPSCGDGSFLSVISNRLTELGTTISQIKQNVLGIELDEVEAKKSANYNARVICEDFFTYYNEYIDEKTQFDVIVGNPPFIRYQNFTEEYRKIAFSLMVKHGFHPNRLTNIWLPFLLLSCKALKPGGRLGMVIPAELFQVNYAAEARQFLSTYFDSLTLVTFKRLVFDNIQQEVVLLLGERNCNAMGISVVELEDLNALINQGQTCLQTTERKKLDHSKDKWTKYFLSSEELDLLNKLNTDSRITNASELFEINVGLVSGENDFFVVNQMTVSNHNIEDAVVPIISRSEQVKGIQLTDEDYSALVSNDKRVFFFDPENVDIESLSDAQRKYILWGEKQGYNKNYKCRIRPRWYYVSQTWRPEAFLIRQAHLYPRMIMNNKNSLVTDTLHKVRFIEGVQGQCVTAAFMNTYTFALSETLGRSYGGGVLTFEPGEIRNLRIPMINAENLDFNMIDNAQRNGEIEKILEYTDEILLKKGLNLSDYEIELLHSVWEKMRNRRMIRKNQN